jgi:uncharacterized membrane protein YqgA involved in biofilm formation
MGLTTIHAGCRGGSVLLLGLGLQLLEVTQVRVAALLPALVLAPV